MNFRDELGRLKEMCTHSKEIQQWQDFPFEFKRIPEVDENLFILSIYALIDNFIMAEYKVPDGIGVNDLAAVLTGPVTMEKTQMIVFERGKRVVKLIGSQAQVAGTKRSIELMTGKTLLCDLLPEISCRKASNTDDSRIAETKDDDYNEEEFLDDDDTWECSTHFGYWKTNKGVDVYMPSDRKHKSEIKLENKSKKKGKKKWQEERQKKYSDNVWNASE